VSEFLLKYADARGQIKQEVVDGKSENEIRDKFANQGFLVYSIKPKGKFDAITTGAGKSRPKQIDLEKFLIFNQQFLTLVRAGLPILRGFQVGCSRISQEVWERGRHPGR